MFDSMRPGMWSGDVPAPPRGFHRGVDVVRTMVEEGQAFYGRADTAEGMEVRECYQLGEKWCGWFITRIEYRAHGGGGTILEAWGRREISKKHVEAVI